MVLEALETNVARKHPSCIQGGRLATAWVRSDAVRPNSDGQCARDRRTAPPSGRTACIAARGPRSSPSAPPPPIPCFRRPCFKTVSCIPPAASLSTRDASRCGGPLGDSSTVELRTLTPSILVRNPGPPAKLSFKYLIYLKIIRSAMRMGSHPFQPVQFAGPIPKDVAARVGRREIVRRIATWRPARELKSHLYFPNAY